MGQLVKKIMSPLDPRSWNGRSERVQLVLALTVFAFALMMGITFLIKVLLSSVL